MSRNDWKRRGIAAALAMGAMVPGAWAGIDDGPYVRRADGGKSLSVQWVCDGKVQETEYTNVDFPTVVKPECGFEFPLSVASASTADGWDFQNVSKIAAISDIHGQYGIMRQLLIAHGVMNEAGQWTFGAGHLVVNGDILDRGAQVTEALWLTYSLQQQAQAQGGKVHFLIGNHEAMVMSGNVKDVNKKYKEVAKLLKAPKGNLYPQNTVLGEWMNKSQAIIRINDVLFVHGGIGKEFLELGLDIPQTNAQFLRANGFMSRAEINADAVLGPLYSGSGVTASPFWNRGLAKQEVTQSFVDEMLRHFGTNRVVIGHTTQKMIESFYESRVIVIDAGIKGGKNGELLLIDSDGFRRGLLKGGTAPLAISHRITAQAQLPEGGELTCDEDVVEHASSAACDAHPKPGYRLARWSVEQCADALRCTVPNIRKDTTITAYFEPLTHALTARAEPPQGGMVKCDATSIVHGGGARCTATASAGYQLSSWSIPACAAKEHCEIAGIEADASITATFVPHPYERQVELNNGKGGKASVAVSGAGCRIRSFDFTAAPQQLPAGMQGFPFGIAAFELDTCEKGGTATVRITYPESVEHLKQWKWRDGQWHAMPAKVSGNTVEFNITDGDPIFDLTPADGVIKDPSGLALPKAVPPIVAPTPVPVGGWPALLLMGAVLGVAFAGQRRAGRGG